MTPGHILAARYELRRSVGRGGMGEVWAAHDRVLDREVAIKALDTQAVRDEGLVQRFHREATAAASLSHPHVVAIHDAGVEGNVAFIVMELLSGPTVAELISQHGMLPVDEALDLARQAASGLAAVHEVGVVHRDVKPGNLVLDRHGRLKVVDFGIARLAEADATQVTATGNVVGSAGFLSPEQARGAAATPASDHYALGCTLMTMLTGRPPFAAEHPVAVLRQHLDDEPPRVRDRRPEVPAEVDELVDALLAKDPARRATGVATLLGASTPPTPSYDAHATAVLPAPPVGGTAVLPQPPMDPPSGADHLPGRGLLIAVAALVAALLVIGLLVGLLDDDGAQEPTAADTASASATPPATSEPAPSPSAPPTADATMSLAAAIAALEETIEQAASSGGLDDKGAEELLKMVGALGAGSEDQDDEDDEDEDEGSSKSKGKKKGEERGNADRADGADGADEADEGPSVDQQLDELDSKVDDLEAKGSLEGSSAAEIRDAIETVRTVA